MSITKHGIFWGQYGISWSKGGSTCNGNGYHSIHISISWKVGNGDDGNRSFLNNLTI
jgi:hypothetical protein